MRQWANEQGGKRTPLWLLALCSLALWCAENTAVAANLDAYSATTELSARSSTPASVAADSAETTTGAVVTARGAGEIASATSPSGVYDNELESQIKEGERASEPANKEAGSARQAPQLWHWNWIHKQDHWGFKRNRFIGKYGLLGIKLGGRLMVDAGLLGQHESLDLAYPDFAGAVTNIRSAEIAVTGYFGPYIVFNLQAELAPDVRGIKDGFVVFKEIPYVSNLRVGIAKEPYSLESLTSLKSTTFMERSLMHALTPGRSFGALIYEDFLDQRMTLAGGVFYRAASWADLDFDTSKGIDMSVRMTALPHVGPEGTVVHLGISVLERQHVGDVELSTRPETLLTDTTYVDTGDIDADRTSSLALELAWQRRGLTVQAEYARAAIATGDGGPTFDGGYVAGSYILTGETRRYYRSSGTFGTIAPHAPFTWGKGGGSGALEVALRLSTIDLDDRSLRGGVEHNLTTGFNWYPSAKMRFMANYVHGWVASQGDGRFNIVQGRFQIHY